MHAFEKKDECFVHLGSPGRAAADASLKVRQSHSVFPLPVTTLSPSGCLQATGDLDHYWEKATSMNKQGCTLHHGAPFYGGGSRVKAIRDKMTYNITQNRSLSFISSKYFQAMSVMLTTEDYLLMTQYQLSQDSLTGFKVASYISICLASMQRGNTIELLRCVMYCLFCHWSFLDCLLDVWPNKHTLSVCHSLSLSLSLTHTHTHTYTCTYALTHTRLHTLLVHRVTGRQLDTSEL